MQEYFYILERLDIQERLDKLSESLLGKKVILYGANSALNAISSKYVLKDYFNVVGVCDDNIVNTNVFEQNDFKMISLQNLYFSGVDVIINLKENSRNLGKYLKKNRLIKKRVKVINLFDKSFIQRVNEIFNLLCKSVSTYEQTKKLLPIVKSWFLNNFNETISSLNYQTKLSQIKKNSDKPVRVMFLVFDYEHWTLSELYYKLREDENFKVLPVVVLPNSLNSNNTAVEETINYFNNIGINCVNGIEADSGDAVMIKALKPDLIIYQKPQYLKMDYTTSKFSDFALTCFIESSFPFEKSSLPNNFMKDRLNNTWQIYLSNNFELKSYKRADVAGFTLFEKYQKENILPCDNFWCSNEALENNRIVYIPSFILNEEFNVSKFREQQRFMLEYMASNPKYSFVVILDENFMQYSLDSNIILKEEFEVYFNRFKSLPNVVISTYDKAIEIFRTSNVLVTDSLKSAFNYFPSGKPIIYINNEKHAVPLNMMGDKIFKTFYRLSSKDAIDIVLEDLLIAENDYNLKHRFAILGKHSELFNKNSTEFIYNDLKTKLGKNNLSEDI